MNQTNKKKLTRSALGIATLGLVAGGVAINKNKQSNSRDAQTLEYDQITPVRQDIQKNLTFGEYRDMLKPITPYVMLELILNEGVKLDKSGKYCVPYQDSRGVWTIAFGITATRDGKKVTKNTKPIPIERAWDESIHFLENRETYFLMYCYDVGCPDLRIDNAAHACAFASVFYNAGTKLMEEPEDKNHRERNETLRKLYKKHGNNVTAEMVRECFEKYPVVSPRSFGVRAIGGESDRRIADILGLYTVGGRGMWSRRWIEGQILMGNINPREFLNLPIQATYEFFLMMGEKREVFWLGADNDIKINMKTLNSFNEWIKNPVTRDGKTPFKSQTIGELLAQINPKILAEFNSNEYALATLSDGKTITFAAAQHDMYQQQYDTALAEFKGGKYKSAKKRFEKILSERPDDALVWNDLAATHNQLGEYDDAIACVHEITRRIGDKSQYAAAYYNAGVSYEAQGNTERALKNYKLAITHGNKSKDVTAAVARMERTTKSKSKAQAYNAGTQKLKARMSKRPMNRTARKTYA